MCEQCLEIEMNDPEISLKDEEGNCNAMLSKIGTAYNQCTMLGACAFTCKNELTAITALIDCSVSENCAKHSVHVFIMNA